MCGGGSVSRQRRVGCRWPSWWRGRRRCDGRMVRQTTSGVERQRPGMKGEGRRDQGTGLRPSSLLLALAGGKRAVSRRDELGKERRGKWVDVEEGREPPGFLILRQTSSPDFFARLLRQASSPDLPPRSRRLKAAGEGEDLKGDAGATPSCPPRLAGRSWRALGGAAEGRLGVVTRQGDRFPGSISQGAARVICVRC